ncbi:MAG TPA: ABC transporter permease [Thermoanaerobaculia bacterium]|nr:ABC transporter permease [Thermoanaerobaculia bacterium]
MRAARALAWREVVRFLRQPSRIVGAFAPPLLAWLLLGAGFGSSFRVPGGGPASYISYFFPGTVVLVVLFAAIFSTISVIEDRREGFLQAVVVSPVSPLAVAAGKIAGGTLLALAQGGVLLLLAPVLGYAPSLAALVPALLVLAFVALALTGLGLAIAWMLESTQGFHAIMNLFLIPMWFLSGSFFPAEGAPAWLRAAMAVNPLTYGVASLRRALDPSAAGIPSSGLSIAVTFTFALGTALVATAAITRYPAGPASAALRSRRKKP